MVEAPPGTAILKLYEGLRKAESSLAIQLRLGTNGLDAFLSRPESPFCFPHSAAAAEDDKRQNMSSSFALGMPQHDTSSGISRDIFLIIHSCLGLLMNYKKPPNG